MKTHLDQLSWRDVEQLDKGTALIILPLGATEQHGPHLPLMTDTAQVSAVLKAALAILPAHVNAWALPALAFTKSGEHSAFAGTISLSSSTLMAVLSDIARSISAAGFQRLVFLNGHGGNVGLLDSSARDIHLETGLECFCIQPSYWLQPPFAISDQEATWGIHAGELETSLMLHLAPELVAMDQAIAHYPDYPKGDLHLFGPASSAWRTDSLSPEGVFGDATTASAAKGARLLQHAASRLASIIEAISNFEVGHG